MPTTEYHSAYSTIMKSSVFLYIEHVNMGFRSQLITILFGADFRISPLQSDVHRIGVLLFHHQSGICAARTADMPDMCFGAPRYRTHFIHSACARHSARLCRSIRYSHQPHQSVYTLGYTSPGGGRGAQHMASSRAYGVACLLCMVCRRFYSHEYIIFKEPKVYLSEVWFSHYPQKNPEALPHPNGYIIVNLCFAEVAVKLTNTLLTAVASPFLTGKPGRWRSP